MWKLDTPKQVTKSFNFNSSFSDLIIDFDSLERPFPNNCNFDFTQTLIADDEYFLSAVPILTQTGADRMLWKLSLTWLCRFSSLNGWCDSFSRFSCSLHRVDVVLNSIASLMDWCWVFSIPQRNVVTSNLGFPFNSKISKNLATDVDNQLSFFRCFVDDLTHSIFHCSGQLMLKTFTLSKLRWLVNFSF